MGVTDQAWLADAHLFVAVAKARSFSRAAAALRLSNSVLSRRVMELEHALGLRLLNRTTRRVELTEDGASFLSRIEHLLEDAEVIREDLRTRTRLPGGLLRVSMPESVASRLAMPWLTEFSVLYPDIDIEIDTAPDHIDPVADNFDVCIHDNAVRSSPLVIRRLASFTRSLYASPSYVAAKGMPGHPDDLVDHQCIRLGTRETARSVWRLTRGRETVSVEVSGRLASVSLDLGWALAINGAGIAAATTRGFEMELAQGKLTRILPGWDFEPLVLSAIMPNRQLPAKTRVFIDFFAEKLDAVRARLG